jgi:hypothetical protein
LTIQFIIIYICTLIIQTIHSNLVPCCSLSLSLLIYSDHVWFKLAHQTSYSNSIEEEFQPLTWTRKDSRTNWSEKYKEINQVKPSSSSPPTMSIDVDAADSGPTPKELREAAWNAEDNHTMTKNEARAFYKDLGGRKLRDKSGKGLGSDRTGWQDQEIYD